MAKELEAPVTVYGWIRDPKPVVVEIAMPVRPPPGPPSSDKDEIIIINEGYSEQDEIKSNDKVFSVSGMMCVTEDGSVFAGRGTRNQTDLSYRFIQYHLDMPNQDRTMVQPNYILLESQFLKHHFVHWDVSGLKVACLPSRYTGDGAPSVNIRCVHDQQFVWIIPTENSNQSALQTFGKDYYLEFTGADLKATLREGSPSANSNFRIDSVSVL